MKGSLVPCTALLWMVIFVGTLSALYSLYDRYTENHCEAVETQNNQKMIFKDACLNLSKKESLLKARMMDSSYCTKVEHDLHKDPSQIAMIKTINGAFDVCTSEECRSALANIYYLVEVTILGVVVIVILLSACGCQIMRTAKISISERDLPVNNGMMYTNTPIQRRHGDVSKLYNDTSPYSNKKD